MTANYTASRQREHELLTDLVRGGSAEDARRALLALPEAMSDPTRMVPGAQLYDTYILNIITEEYS